MPQFAPPTTARHMAGALALVSFGLLTGVTSPAAADEIFLCDESKTSHVVIRSGAPPLTARLDPCVRAYHDQRREEAIRRMAEARRMSELFHSNGAPTGVSTRDFCGPGENCRQPLPRWTKRWNQDDGTERRTLYFRHIFDRY